MKDLYDESGSPIGLQYRTNSYAAGVFDTYYFEKNWQGDILAVYTEAGVLIGSYTYDAWGNCTVSEVSTATSLQRSIVRARNPFRYRGYYYDTETQLYYLQSRYYNPATGRFINADGYISTGTGLLGYNMYAYCSNNPVMHVDHDGLAEDDLQELDDTGGLIDLDGLGGRAQQPTRYQAQREGRATGKTYYYSGSSYSTNSKTSSTKNTFGGKWNSAIGIKTGWKVGDNIRNPTAAGNKPAWSTVRQRAWKNEVHYNGNSYSPDDRFRMRQGKPPMAGGFPVEFHHPMGRLGNNFWYFYPLPRWEHYREHYG